MREPEARKTTAFAVVAALVLVGAACGAGTDEAGSAAAAPPPTTAAASRPSSPATLTIVSPTQEQVIAGSTAQLEVELEGGKIVPQTSTDIQPDEGHLHVILDDQLISMTSGTESLLSDLTPGQHLLKVEFVAADHAPFDPRVVAAVSFEVKP
jgi:hypothetical protein